MGRQNSKGEELNFLVLLFWNQLLDLETGCERYLLLANFRLTVLSQGLRDTAPRSSGCFLPDLLGNREWGQAALLTQNTGAGGSTLGSSAGVSGWGAEPWIPRDFVQKDSGFSVESGDSGLALPSLLIAHNLSPQFQNPVPCREESHVSKG